MPNLRLFSIIAWIALPTVMYGGYALLGLLTRDGLTPFQQTFFRAGHAHAGVLLLLSLLYHSYLEQTTLRPAIKIGAAVIVLVGILAQSGGFFLHMLIGQPGAPIVARNRCLFIWTMGLEELAGPSEKSFRSALRVENA